MSDWQFQIIFKSSEESLTPCKQRSDMILWCRMISLMEVCRIKHGAKIWIIYFERKLLKLHWLWIHLLTDHKIQSPFLVGRRVVVNYYIFQLSIGSSKCNFIKTSLVFLCFSLKWMFTSVYLLLFFEARVKLISHQTIQKVSARWSRKSPLPFVIFRGRGVWRGAISHLFLLKITFYPNLMDVVWLA